MACKPSVYVLDEPSSNLDPPSMEKLASFISKAKSSGSAVIIAEHRLSYLASVADRYLLFEAVPSPPNGTRSDSWGCPTRSESPAGSDPPSRRSSPT